MKIELYHKSTKFCVDLSRGMDISIPLKNGSSGPKCFYAPDFRIEPVIAGDFVGSVDQGSPVNFKNIMVNPHGNGTHTECVGHITSEQIFINDSLKEYHFLAKLITVKPISNIDGDEIIALESIKEICNDLDDIKALIVRTTPNDESKKQRDYSGTNPPYFSSDAITYINESGIIHLITDLPSIDREEDGGALAGHKLYWGYPDFHDKRKTITEMVYIADEISDGLYFCNMQIASIESDASPSKIVLYDLENVTE